MSLTCTENIWEKHLLECGKKTSKTILTAQHIVLLLRCRHITFTNGVDFVAMPVSDQICMRSRHDMQFNGIIS